MTHHIPWLMLCACAPFVHVWLLFFAICAWQGTCQTNKLGIIGQKVRLEVGRVFVHIVQ